MIHPFNRFRDRSIARLVGDVSPPSTLTSRFLGHIILPPVPRPLDSIETSGVGLDIEHRRSVEDVDVLEEQGIAFPSNELDDAHSNRVGSARRTGREHPMGRVLEKGLDEKLRLPGAVEVVDDVQVRESLDVLEPLGILCFDDETPPAADGIDRLNGRLFLDGVLAVDCADRRKGNRFRGFSPIVRNVDGGRESRRRAALRP